MLPVVGVAKTVQRQMRPYRDLFRRSEGFEYVSRYVTGLLVSPNKTSPGMYAAQGWEGEGPSYRARHEAVFEAGWEAEELLPRHRRLIVAEHRGRGREVISLDWTLVHHGRGPHMGNAAARLRVKSFRRYFPLLNVSLLVGIRASKSLKC